MRAFEISGVLQCVLYTTSPTSDAAAAGGYIVVEVVLGVSKVERRRDLHEVGADLGGLPRQPHQLPGARGLATHHHRDPPGGLAHHGLGDGHAFVEGHGGEIPGRAAGEQYSGAGGDAAVDQEAHVAAHGVEIDAQLGVVTEHGGKGHVAALQPLPGVRVAGCHTVTMAYNPRRSNNRSRCVSS